MIIAVLALAAPGVTWAQATGERPQALNRLVECRAVADSAARLACYDQATDALDAAERQGEVVVVDRGQVREARRQLFGFDMPSMPTLFSRGGEAEEINNIETTLDRAVVGSEGKWLFVLADGTTWRQIDSDRVRFSDRAGVPVRIRRAAMGSYLLVVDRSRAVRVRRQ